MVGALAVVQGTGAAPRAKVSAFRIDSFFTQETGAAALRKHVEEEVRDLSGEALTRFMDSLFDRITALIDSPDVSDNLGALRAIDALIDVKLGESGTKTMKFGTYIRRIFEEKQDSDLLVTASEVLGHLVTSGGPQTADIVESQVRSALEWLRADRVESRRFASVLILKEMAYKAPTVFNVHVPEFVDRIWVALRDSKQAIREHAVEALRACLSVIVTRETRWRVRWYYRMFEDTQAGLGKNATVESIHGSLLAVGELLRNTGEFMMSRYKEVLDIAFKFRDHRDKLVRRSITALLPRIAHFLRDRFVTSYFNTSMEHLLAVMSNPLERASGFIALGEMAAAVGYALKPHLSAIMTLLRSAIQPRRGKPSMEAIACIGNLAEALGPLMEDHVRNSLELMFATGLSSTLEHALNQIVTSLPCLLPTVQKRLRETISAVLMRSLPTKTVPARLPQGGPAGPSTSEIAALVQLALQILTNFDFKGHDLLNFTREAVVPYLEDDDPAVRRDAARCCCRLVENSCQVGIVARPSSRLSSRSARPFGYKKHRLLIEEILEKLLVAAVSDTDSAVRQDVFLSLSSSASFADFLIQADSLTAIFIAFNDEAFEVRKLSIAMAGKLSEKNPAYALPALRRHLQQLLTDMEHSSDSKRKEESAVLLGVLIRSCETLITPYVAPIHKSLVARLKEGTSASGNIGVITGVMSTVGELARVAGCVIRPYIGELMPLIVEALLDSSAASKRDVAVTTLGQLVHSTGYVIAPYTDYPALLGALLRLLNGELEWSTRSMVLKVLGVLGALDPHVNKRKQLLFDGNRSTLSERISIDESADIWPSGVPSAAQEDYYSTVAINALMRILREPSLSIYHQNVVKSLMYICRVMGLGCVPYLPQVMPDLLHTIRNCEDSLREFILCQLADLVTIVRQHIRNYLPSILSLVLDMIITPNTRGSSQSPILRLVERLCLALHDEFRIYMPEILPKCIQALNEAERNGDFGYVASLLHTFEVFGGTLDEHMHLVVPALVRLFKPDVSNAPLAIRRSTIKTFARLLPCMQVTAHVSSLLHPLLAVLDGTRDELRKDAVDAICVLATILGDKFFVFVPSVRKLLQRHHLQHSKFDVIESRLRKREPIMLEVQPSSLPETDAAASSHGLDLEGEVHNFDGSESSMQRQKINEGQLKSAWESSQRSTKEDWAEWMRHFSLELLKESPSPALRTCAPLAQRQPHVARELFAVAFVSCWSQLNDLHQKQLVRSLNYALTSPNIPPEILATLLNLAEFMERDENPLPVDTRTLGGLAEKCHLFAKALHYKEMEFDMVFEGAQNNVGDRQHAGATNHQLVAAVEALIHVNNQLHQHEAAVGILTYAQQNLGVELKESWYEKLQRWEDALKAYTFKAAQATSPHASLEPTLGRMRCLAALARWEELRLLCKEAWKDPAVRPQMAPMAASAAWNMGEWDDMEEYVSNLREGEELNVTTRGDDGDGKGFVAAFFRAVLCVRRSKYEKAAVYADKARKCLANELAALVLESYDRAYSNMVRVQQLAELEEVIEYCTLQPGTTTFETRGCMIRKMWRDRIRGAKRNVEVWQRLLSVRTLVLPPSEDTETWLKFASLCYKSGRVSQARSTLIKLLQYDPELSEPPDSYVVDPPVMLAYLKYLWSSGEDSKRRQAYRRLQELASDLAQNSQYYQTASCTSSASSASLLARIYLKLGTWNWLLHPSLPRERGVSTTGLDDDSIREISTAYKSATDHARAWAKAWHKWALFNTAALSHYTLKGDHTKAGHHVVSAVSGYFKSIANASTNKGGDDSLQDILRLLTLWFNHGASDEVCAALQDGFKHVNIDTWLVVLPQIIARIHSHIPAVRDLIQWLLVRIGQFHPQALMYPLLVACKSISSLRKTAAQSVVDKVKQHHPLLVEQAHLVSQELIRVAILWHEMWYEALEEASRLYFGEHNVEGMLNVLEPLHHKLEDEGAVTVKEIAFVQAYGRELQEAHECCIKYRRTGKEAELTQAWDLYYHVFKRINKQLPSVTTLELQYVSPALLNARNLELAVPGTYRAGAPVVTIQSFEPQLMVMTSKQRPRKCTIKGSDGQDYAFLLKGHEDLRQDERVMQLFGLVNTLLSNARHTAEKDLSIQRYDVVPLSPNSGLIGWVPNCDTLHQLIREYRDGRKTPIPVNAEHRLMLSFAPDHDHLPLIAKVEVFEYALDKTAGDDLAKVFWLKSKTSEVWLERRTNYTRSLAVMSMVGYLLGLGDRHPSNLMLNRYSGKILHIDFGDCFEASMNREKFPEKVPFRLTRMLVKAMEVSGIEGNFRSTCEDVMQVLRSNKDSVMAMMEAFVHDPLINWRLFNINDVPASMANIRAQTAAQNVEPAALPSPPQRGAREREMLHVFNAVGQLGDANANEVLNERAVSVMGRMSDKLTGRDFPSGSSSSHVHSGDNYVGDPLSVKDQVQKLIAQATNHENLCQSYVGWCPFW